MCELGRIYQRDLEAEIAAMGRRLMHSPQPKRGDKGGDILGPTNPDRARQAPDSVRPPKTDAGKMPNMKWCGTNRQGLRVI